MTSHQRRKMKNRNMDINLNLYNGERFSLGRVNPRCQLYNGRPVTPGTDVYAPYVPEEPSSCDDDETYTPAALREGSIKSESESAENSTNAATKDLKGNHSSTSWPPPSRPSIPGPSTSGLSSSRPRKPLLRATDDINRERGYSEWRSLAAADQRGFPTATKRPRSLTYAKVASRHRRSSVPRTKVLPSGILSPKVSNRGHQVRSEPPDWLMRAWDSINFPKPWTDIPGNLSFFRLSATSIPPNGPSVCPVLSSVLTPMEEFYANIKKNGQFTAASQSERNVPSELFATYLFDSNSPTGTYSSELSYFGHIYRIVPTSPNYQDSSYAGEFAEYLDPNYNPSEGVSARAVGSRSPGPIYLAHKNRPQALYSGVSYSSFRGVPATLNLPKAFDSEDVHTLMSDTLNRAMERFPGNIYEVLVLAVKDLEWGKIKFNALKTTQDREGKPNWCVTLYLERQGLVQILVGPEGPCPTPREALDEAAAKFIKTSLQDPSNFPIARVIFAPYDVPRRTITTRRTSSAPRRGTSTMPSQGTRYN